MRVLVACESSGVVRRAFRALGHDAWSCDIKPPEDGSEHHLLGNVKFALDGDNGFFFRNLGGHTKWDMMIAFPPCTDLAVSGARWFPAKRADGRQARALRLVGVLLNADIPRIALENPVSVISSFYRKPDQTIQPWQFGHGEVKRTCLWLKNLPPLVPTDIVAGREARVWKMAPSATRATDRARTYEGIAAAMAAQWGAP